MDWPSSSPTGKDLIYLLLLRMMLVIKSAPDLFFWNQTHVSKRFPLPDLGRDCLSGFEQGGRPVGLKGSTWLFAIQAMNINDQSHQRWHCQVASPSSRELVWFGGWTTLSLGWLPTRNPVVSWKSRGNLSSGKKNYASTKLWSNITSYIYN